jgi:hypothetical protein
MHVGRPPPRPSCPLGEARHAPEPGTLHGVLRRRAGILAASQTVAEAAAPIAESAAANGCVLFADGSEGCTLGTDGDHRWQRRLASLPVAGLKINQELSENIGSIFAIQNSGLYVKMHIVFYIYPLIWIVTTDRELNEGSF